MLILLLSAFDSFLLFQLYVLCLSNHNEPKPIALHAVHCITAHHSTAQHSTAQHSTFTFSQLSSAVAALSMLLFFPIPFCAV